jgi:phenolic acid decarboxylase
MIEPANQENWKDLQIAVCRLFNEIGLTAQTEVKLKTPRGCVEVDVYAVDERSVDKIKYIAECKNWNSTIPQHVVHSFTTVMHETGANIGFIISKLGLQKGAEQYTNNTNIIGLTYEDLQKRYFEAWWNNHFCICVAQAAENLCFYTEPINWRRDEALAKIDDSSFKKFEILQKKYDAFSMLMWHHDLGVISKRWKTEPPKSIDEYKSKFIEVLGERFSFKSIYWRDLLEEICAFLKNGEKELEHIFGRNIFEQT